MSVKNTLCFVPNDMRLLDMLDAWTQAGTLGSVWMDGQIDSKKTKTKNQPTKKNPAEIYPLTCYNIFITGLAEVTECTLCMFVDDTKLGWLVNAFEGKAAVQRDWGWRNRLKFSKDKMQSTTPRMELTLAATQAKHWLVGEQLYWKVPGSLDGQPEDEQEPSAKMAGAVLAEAETLVLEKRLSSSSQDWLNCI